MVSFPDPVIAFSPDGRTAMAGSEDGRASCGTPPPASRGAPCRHTAWCRAWRSAPTASLVTGSGDKTARLWDAATGQPLGPPLQGHTRRCVERRRSAPTARPSSPGATTGRRGCGTPPPASPRPAPAGHTGRVDERGVQPRRQDRRHRQRRTRRRGCGTPPPASRSAAPAGHKDRVGGVAFSPDGKTLVTGARTRRRGCGTPPPASPSARPCKGTRARCRAWRSAPTARPSSPAATTRRRGSGTPPPASRSARPCKGTRARCGASPSAPTARRLVTGSCGHDGAALGRRHRPAARPAAARAHGRGVRAWRSAPTARPS